MLEGISVGWIAVGMSIEFREIDSVNRIDRIDKGGVEIKGESTTSKISTTARGEQRGDSDKQGRSSDSMTAAVGTHNNNNHIDTVSAATAADVTTTSGAEARA